ncbi:hypothetical protein C8Q74DRAFT_1289849 [Fomes fomentarius]|nr:hypothetical protein C8Q74DRAFT_1289849 [Fomes fomentarius]
MFTSFKLLTAILAACSTGALANLTVDGKAFKLNNIIDYVTGSMSCDGFNIEPHTHGGRISSAVFAGNVESTEPTLQVSALCGQEMVVLDTANGRNVTVIVEDICAECAPTDIMLGEAAFDELAGDDNRVDAIDVTWSIPFNQ